MSPKKGIHHLKWHKMFLWLQIAEKLLRAFNISRIRRKRRRRGGGRREEQRTKWCGIKSVLRIFLQIQIEMCNRKMDHEGGFLFLVVYFLYCDCRDFFYTLFSGVYSRFGCNTSSCRK